MQMSVKRIQFKHFILNKSTSSNMDVRQCKVFVENVQFDKRDEKKSG